MTASDRPRPEYQTSPLIRVLRWSGCAAAVIAAAVLSVTYGSLPEVIPTHFNGAGEADAWGPRSSVWGVLAVWFVMQALLAVLSTQPRVFNFPVPVTDANAGYLFREGERLVVLMGVALAAVFTGILLLSVQSPVGGPVLGLGLAGLLATLAFGIARLLRADRA